MYGKAWMSKQKSAAGAELSWRISTRAVWRGNVGLESPHRVPIGALPIGTVRRGPPSTRPQNGKHNSFLHAPRKAADTQCQPMKAVLGAVPCRATGVELPKALGSCPFHQCGLNVRHSSKADYFGAVRCNDYPAGFQTCMGSVAPLFWPIYPFWNGSICPMPALPLYLESNELVFDCAGS
uniref:Uncharacterized protein n=1 Tax=Macaca fascicularis TaxID=9541 RepID=A0A7N9CI69_MACFA